MAHDGPTCPITCPCICHSSPGAPCSVDGGCQDDPTAEPTTDTTPAELEPADFRTLDGKQACIFGCLIRHTHKPGCPCTTTCPEHEGHCDGCANRPAHDESLLCGSCFWRKLHGPLKRIPALIDWLTINKAGLKATAYDRDLVSSSKEAPMPFRADVVDLIDRHDHFLARWAVGVARRITPPEPTPRTRKAGPASVWLLERDSWISNQRWVGLLTNDLHTLAREIDHLAPWKPAKHRLPMPCLHCNQQALVLTAGDDWVDCTNPDCRAAIGYDRYQRLERAIAGVHEHDPEGTDHA